MCVHRQECVLQCVHVSTVVCVRVCTCAGMRACGLAYVCVLCIYACVSACMCLCADKACTGGSFHRLLLAQLWSSLQACVQRLCAPLCPLHPCPPALHTFTRSASFSALSTSPTLRRLPEGEPQPHPPYFHRLHTAALPPCAASTLYRFFEGAYETS